MIKVGYNIDNRNANDDATNNFIGRVRTNKRVTRGQALENNSVESSAKQQLKITTFEVMMTT